MEKLYLSPKEFAQMLGVSSRIVQRWCETGQLRHIRIDAGTRKRFRIKITDVEAFLAEREVSIDRIQEPTPKPEKKSKRGRKSLINIYN